MYLHLKDAKNIYDWLDEESDAKDGNDAENQKERARQIKERLFALGWAEERYVNTMFLYYRID